MRGVFRRSALLGWLGLAITMAMPIRAAGAAAPAAPEVDVEVFIRRGCPRCAAAERFLESLRSERTELRVVLRRIDEDPDALGRLKDLAARKGASVIGVPAFYVRGEILVGFVGEDSTGARIRALVEGTGAAPAPEGGVCIATETEACAGSEDLERVSLPWIGPLSVRDVGLPLFTIAIGLLDGFNPCAMWVLLFLLSLLVNVQDRAKMLLIAGTFVVASGLVYFAFMAAWLNVFMLIGFSAVSRAILGGVAVVVGLVNVKDFFLFGRGISLSIPASAKPRIYSYARRVLQAENLAGALVGVIVLAGMVNVVELLCTAGFPAVYTHILAQRHLAWWVYGGYLALYNAAYMLDDAIMVLTAVVTLSRFKLQKRGGRWLKLTSGVVLLALGLVLLARPDWLPFEPT